MKKTILLFALTIFFTFNAVAFAATINVPADQPTIQAGIDVAVDGDVVLVAPGTYVENIDFLGKAITVQSAGGAVIDGGGVPSGVLVTFESGEGEESVLDGFTIQNGWPFSGGGSIYCSGSSPTIANCTITNSHDKGIHSSGGGSPTITNCTVSRNNGMGIQLGGGSPTITNCTVSENNSIGIYSDYSSHVIEGSTIIGNSYGISFDGIGSPTIINNEVRDNENSGISAWYSEGGLVEIVGNTVTGNSEGIYIHMSISPPSIFGNTISGNTTGIYCYYSVAIVTGNTISGNTTGIYCSYDPIVITNNTIAGNDDAGISCHASDSTITNNTVDSLGVALEAVDSSWPLVTNTILMGDVIIGLGSFATIQYSDIFGDIVGALEELENIYVDPLFVGGGDYHLTAGSPCIDAGTDAGVYIDIDGEDRPIGPGFDMGSDEYGIVICDADGDGYDHLYCGGTDCDDFDPGVYPGAEEICDGVDNDCDGMVPDDEADADEDGWMICEGDCDDTDPAINPDAEEICGDGIDNDCDELVDYEDDECVLTEFVLGLTATHEAGYLNLDFTIGTPEPARWSTYLIPLQPVPRIIPLWSVGLPVLNPIEVPITLPLPDIGPFIILATLFTAEWDGAFTLDSVDTM